MATYYYILNLEKLTLSLAADGAFSATFVRISTRIMRTEYKIGDQVQVIATTSSWFGKQGTVTNLHKDKEQITVKVGNQRGRCFNVRSIRRIDDNDNDEPRTSTNERAGRHHPSTESVSSMESNQEADESFVLSELHDVKDELNDVKKEMAKMKEMFMMMMKFIGMRVNDKKNSTHRSSRGG